MQNMIFLVMSLHFPEKVLSNQQFTNFFQGSCTERSSIRVGQVWYYVWTKFDTRGAGYHSMSTTRIVLVLQQSLSSNKLSKVSPYSVYYCIYSILKLIIYKYYIFCKVEKPSKRKTRPDILPI